MKTNKYTETVFLGLLDTEELIGKLTQFINAGDNDDPNQQKYNEIVSNIKKDIKELSTLEEIILQVRAWKNLKNEDIKITITREYIYVRAPFYRSDKVAKEIRAIVGKIEDWPLATVSVENMYDDTTFMSIAKNALARQMHMVILENLEKYSINYKRQKV